MTARFSDDDEDWVGTPPEGRHTRAQADPGYWQRNWQAQAIVFGLLFVGVIIVLVLALS